MKDFELIQNLKYLLILICFVYKRSTTQNNPNCPNDPNDLKSIIEHVYGSIVRMILIMFIEKQYSKQGIRPIQVGFCL
jgi:hypothetical protein